MKRAGSGGLKSGGKSGATSTRLESARRSTINSGSNKAAKSARGGASASKTRFADRWGAYWSHHRSSAVESLQRLLRTPFQSLLTWLVVAIALSLPSVLYIALNNVQDVGQGWQGSSQISVFIHRRASDHAIKKLSERLLSRPEVAEVNLVSPEQALAEFQAYSGFGEVLDSLDENPLPTVLLVLPADQVSPEQMRALRAALQDEAVVEEARIDMEWVERLHHILQLGQRLVLSLAGLLALGVLLVIGNTIRLAIESRRDEIVIVKLVGGTNAFVRRPLLYTGLWYGVGGGVLALLLLALGLSWLEAPVARLAELYQSDFQLQGLGWLSSMQLVLGAGFLGLLGAWLAVGRHLGDIEPR